MNLKPLVFAVAAASLMTAQSVQAGWIDWSTPYSGVMDAGGTTVNVTLTGSPTALIDGDYYYNNFATGFTSPTGTYAGMAPSDLIQVSSSTTFTLNFDRPVEDLYMALVSVGQTGLGVTYDFNDPFTVVSAGSNYWGYGSYTVSGTQFTGNEYNGILHFAGTFNSISFSISPNEYWHGFNFASYDPAVTVPEPAALGLLGLSLLGLQLARRRRHLTTQ